MRVLRTLLLASFLIGFLPSFVELSEDVLHLVMEGHTLHTTDHEGEGEQPSHGCDDCSHCVSCHGQGTPFAAPATAQLPAQPRCLRSTGRPSVVGNAQDGVRDRLERPPRA